MKPVTLSRQWTNAGTTGPVLDLLDKHGILSTFFVIGNCGLGPRRPRVARAVAAGHWIGNHSTPSIPLAGGIRRKRPAEINRARPPSAFIPKLFRPFSGGGALGPIC